jgi:hypothetical protein
VSPVDDERCCEIRDNCGNYACNATTHMRIANPEQEYCKGASCTEEDEITCCKTKGMCLLDSFDCNRDGYAKHPEYNHRFCQGLTCTDEDDLNWCCQAVSAAQATTAASGGPEKATTTTVGEEALEGQGGARRLHSLPCALLLLLAFLGMVVKM